MHAASRAPRGRRSRALPGFFVSDAGPYPGRALAAGLLALVLAACSARFDFREVRAPDGRWVAALPDRPQTVEREIRLGGQPVGMTMTSTGVGATMFAIGDAHLPSELATDAALDATIAQVAEPLLRNIGAGTPQRRALTPPPGARRAEEWRGRGRAGPDGRATELVARFIVADDRLLSVIAIAAEGELPEAARDTFFDAFRLAGRGAATGSPR